MGHSSLAEYQRLHRVADEARLKSEQARPRNDADEFGHPGMGARNWKGVLISDAFAAFDVRRRGARRVGNSCFDRYEVASLFCSYCWSPPRGRPAC